MGRFIRCYQQALCHIRERGGGLSDNFACLRVSYCERYLFVFLCKRDVKYSPWDCQDGLKVQINLGDEKTPYSKNPLTPCSCIVKKSAGGNSEIILNVPARTREWQIALTVKTLNFMERRRLDFSVIISHNEFHCERSRTSPRTRSLEIKLHLLFIRRTACDVGKTIATNLGANASQFIPVRVAWVSPDT